jgi:hypothetical protein
MLGLNVFVVLVVPFIREEIRSGSSTAGEPKLLAPSSGNRRAQHSVVAPHASLSFAVESGGRQCAWLRTTTIMASGLGAFSAIQSCLT